ncbi:T9SS type A sorting domain-containing protein [Taibaiella koreensis]|uniref:T9SS type A sorting domain-containing protein n=1 Tax=Taibaiella koreensis TaxID=1268548 RepID=UPI0013C33957|nr:T9SS type A sorting domain-containing protein [Taibaiella koreensis]
MIKKISRALTVALFATSLHAQTFLPSGTPDLVMPASTAMKVYVPIKTSAYSYNDVSFDQGGMGTGPFAPMDLYVYSWNGGNFVNSGIGWIRRNPATSAIIDTGYISVPTTKAYMSVGLLQNSTGTITYVIVSYYQGGAYYDLYRWHPWGLNPTPDFPPIPLRPAVSGSPVRWGFNRIKMDTWDLKRAAFAWDEPVILDGGGAVIDPGGTWVRVLDNTAAPPFTASSGFALQVAGTTAWGIKPDVAFATSGDRVRIAYYNSDTMYAVSSMLQPVYIRNQSFSTLRTALPPTVPFNWDDSVVNATGLIGLAENDHIHLDCPDNFGGDIWSVIFNRNPNQLLARTKPPGGPAVTTLLTTSLSGQNMWPAIAYSQNSTQINYGWYTDVNHNYIATRLSNNGTTFISPSAPGVYFNIALFPGSPIAAGARLSFNRQNNANDRLFLAYPLPGTSGPLNLDMRSKLVPWTSGGFRPETPTGIGEPSLAQGVTLYPNPFRSGFKLAIDGYNNETLHILIADVQGKTVDIFDGSLTKVNGKLGITGNQLTPGIYFISISSESGRWNGMTKVVKQ